MKGRTFSCSFELRKHPSKTRPPSKEYPNPIVLAEAWQRRLESGAAKSRADLAHQLGVSRAHVTQVLRLLLLAPQAKEAVLALGDPIKGRVVGAHTLRSLAKLPDDQQERGISALFARDGN